jgi:hypothetical protein
MHTSTHMMLSIRMGEMEPCIIPKEGVHIYRLGVGPPHPYPHKAQRAYTLSRYMIYTNTFSKYQIEDTNLIKTVRCTSQGPYQLKASKANEVVRKGRTRYIENSCAC